MLNNVEEYMDEIANEILSEVYAELESKLSDCDFWNYVETGFDEESYYVLDRGSREILPGVSMEFSLEIRLSSENLEEYLNEEVNAVRGLIYIFPTKESELKLSGVFESEFDYSKDKGIEIEDFYYTEY